MEPFFFDGDRVISFNFGKILPKNIVVFKLGDKRLIKRVRELCGEKLIVEADNKNLAKKEYKVDKKDIIGRVVVRYRNPLG